MILINYLSIELDIDWNTILKTKKVILKSQKTFQWIGYCLSLKNINSLNTLSIKTFILAQCIPICGEILIIFWQVLYSY